MANKNNITPETYKEMNKEFEEEGLAFRVTIPTQEAIDKCQSIVYYPDDVYKDGGGPSVWDPEWDKIREERYKNGELQ
jgi:hypothetical protein